MKQEAEIIARIEKLEKELRTLKLKRRQICKHDYELSQVAGDGYICKKCGAWKPEDF